MLVSPRFVAKSSRATQSEVGVHMNPELGPGRFSDRNLSGGRNSGPDEASSGVNTNPSENSLPLNHVNYRANPAVSLPDLALPQISASEILQQAYFSDGPLSHKRLMITLRALVRDQSEDTPLGHDTGFTSVRFKSKEGAKAVSQFVINGLTEKGDSVRPGFINMAISVAMGLSEVPWTHDLAEEVLMKALVACTRKLAQIDNPLSSDPGNIETQKLRTRLERSTAQALLQLGDLNFSQEKSKEAIAYYQSGISHLAVVGGYYNVEILPYATALMSLYRDIGDSKNARIICARVEGILLTNEEGNETAKHEANWVLENVTNWLRDKGLSDEIRLH